VEDVNKVNHVPQRIGSWSKVQAVKCTAFPQMFLGEFGRSGRSLGLSIF
jgi:hypothetical protein